ncbi:MAG: hypothetical protein JNL74_07150, partial [Fibrobacteres bacterium]|nr:hypothetical protein [Fibrobacterota bacterium]
LRSGKTGLALPRDISESDTFQSKAFSLIAESHYRIGVETRINALMNMFRLYIDADNKCRKAAMVSFLEDMQLTEGERCENCDVCRPKLDFPETANRLVRADASSRNTAKMLNDTVEELLKKYDVSEMIKFIERTHENVHLKFIRARLSQSIEELPTPSAYFILCEVERKLTGATSKTGLDRILETIPTNMSSESACCLIEWTEQNFKGYEFETASIICFCNPDVQEKKDFVQIFLRVAPAHHKRKLLLFNLVNRHKMLNEGINHGKN